MEIDNYAIYNKEELEELWESLKDRPFPYNVYIQKIDKGRTLDQNDYLFGVVYRRALEHTGFLNVGELHKHLMWQYFLTNWTFNKKGANSGKPPSSSKLYKWEMSNYIDWVVAFIQEEWGINIERKYEY